MKTSIRTASAIVVMAALGLATPTFAQRSADVQFQPGNYGTMLSGTITGDEYFDYKLRAKAGQEMYVSLSVTGTNGSGSAYFNILPPGSDNVAIYNSSAGDQTTTVKLPKSGEYKIRVYLMGNDSDAGKTVGYNVDISIQ